MGRLFRNIITIILLVCFGVSACTVPDVQAQSVSLPAVGEMIGVSAAYQPAMLKGIKIFPNEPFRFDFVVQSSGDDLSVGGDPRVYPDAGEHGGSPLQNSASRTTNDEYLKLVKYFLATLAVPDGDLWVNLSPYESNRIIPDAFGATEMGRDLLAQDYILKQLTASLMNPEGDVGKKFWEEIYSKAYEATGRTDIPVDTFNKIWIVPASAEVYQNGDTAYVVDATLKVMLEEDYLASGISHLASGEKPNTNDQMPNAKEIIRSIILPVIEEEVNHGRHFAPLRQIYSSMILAKWYENHFKASILGQGYVDRNTVEGIELESVGAMASRGESAHESPVQEIYNQYVQAFKQGAYDFLKEEYDPGTQQIIPRRYFSGGVDAGSLNNVMKMSDAAMMGAGQDDRWWNKPHRRVEVDLNPVAKTEAAQKKSSLNHDIAERKLFERMILASVISAFGFVRFHSMGHLMDFSSNALAQIDYFWLNDFIFLPTIASFFFLLAYLPPFINKPQRTSITAITGFYRLFRSAPWPMFTFAVIDELLQQGTPLTFLPSECLRTYYYYDLADLLVLLGSLIFTQHIFMPFLMGFRPKTSGADRAMMGQDIPEELETLILNSKRKSFTDEEKDLIRWLLAEKFSNVSIKRIMESRISPAEARSFTEWLLERRFAPSSATDVIVSGADLQDKKDFIAWSLSVKFTPSLTGKIIVRQGDIKEKQRLMQSGINGGLERWEVVKIMLQSGNLEDKYKTLEEILRRKSLKDKNADELYVWLGNIRDRSGRLMFSDEDKTALVETGAAHLKRMKEFIMFAADLEIVVSSAAKDKAGYFRPQEILQMASRGRDFTDMIRKIEYLAGLKIFTSAQIKDMVLGGGNFSQVLSKTDFLLQETRLKPYVVAMIVEKLPTRAKVERHIRFLTETGLINRPGEAEKDKAVFLYFDRLGVVDPEDLKQLAGIFVELGLDPRRALVWHFDSAKRRNIFTDWMKPGDVWSVDARHEWNFLLSSESLTPDHVIRMASLYLDKTEMDDFSRAVSREMNVVRTRENERQLFRDYLLSIKRQEKDFFSPEEVEAMVARDNVPVADMKNLIEDLLSYEPLEVDGEDKGEAFSANQITRIVTSANFSRVSEVVRYLASLDVFSPGQIAAVAEESPAELQEVQKVTRFLLNDRRLTPLAISAVLKRKISLDVLRDHLEFLKGSGLLSRFPRENTYMDTYFLNLKNVDRSKLIHLANLFSEWNLKRRAALRWHLQDAAIRVVFEEMAQSPLEQWSERAKSEWAFLSASETFDKNALVRLARLYLTEDRIPNFLRHVQPDLERLSREREEAASFESWLRSLTDADGKILFKDDHVQRMMDKAKDGRIKQRSWTSVRSLIERLVELRMFSAEQVTNLVTVPAKTPEEMLEQIDFLEQDGRFPSYAMFYMLRRSMSLPELKQRVAYLDSLGLVKADRTQNKFIYFYFSSIGQFNQNRFEQLVGIFREVDLDPQRAFKWNFESEKMKDILMEWVTKDPQSWSPEAKTEATFVLSSPKADMGAVIRMATLFLEGGYQRKFEHGLISAVINDKVILKDFHALGDGSVDKEAAVRRLLFSWDSSVRNEEEMAVRWNLWKTLSILEDAEGNPVFSEEDKWVIIKGRMETEEKFSLLEYLTSLKMFTGFQMREIFSARESFEEKKSFIQTLLKKEVSYYDGSVLRTEFPDGRMISMAIVRYGNFERTEKLLDDLIKRQIFGVKQLSLILRSRHSPDQMHTLIDAMQKVDHLSSDEMAKVIRSGRSFDAKMRFIEFFAERFRFFNSATILSIIERGMPFEKFQKELQYLAGLGIITDDRFSNRYTDAHFSQGGFLNKPRLAQLVAIFQNLNLDIRRAFVWNSVRREERMRKNFKEWAWQDPKTWSQSARHNIKFLTRSDFFEQDDFLELAGLYLDPQSIREIREKLENDFSDWNLLAQDHLMNIAKVSREDLPYLSDDHIRRFRFSLDPEVRMELRKYLMAFLAPDVVEASKIDREGASYVLDRHVREYNWLSPEAGLSNFSGVFWWKFYQRTKLRVFDEMSPRLKSLYRSMSRYERLQMPVADQDSALQDRGFFLEEIELIRKFGTSLKETISLDRPLGDSKNTVGDTWAANESNPFNFSDEEDFGVAADEEDSDFWDTYREMTGEGEDDAMLETTDVGGIDLNNVNVKTRGEIVPMNVPPDPAMIAPLIRGLSPRILNITDVNVLQFLGLAPSESEEPGDVRPEFVAVRPDD